MLKNNSHALLVLRPKDFLAVACSYESAQPAGKAFANERTIFKTAIKDLAVGDLVVVETGTRHLMTVVRVEELNIQVDFESPTPLAWVVDKIDRTKHDRLVAAEKQTIAAIHASTIRKKREEIAEAVAKDVDASALEAIDAATSATPVLAAPKPEEASAQKQV